MRLPTTEQIDREIERVDLENSLLSYIVWSFKKKTGKDFILNHHHVAICNALEKVFRHETKRLLINMPPRYSKTECAVKGFIEWCLAKVPESRFIHLSYSDMLVLDNSSAIRESIKSDWYQYHWPVRTRKDADSKQLWYTQNGGGLYATGAEGSITGFGAGSTGSGFCGCIIIDDPQKPAEANSQSCRDRINSRLNDTVMTRLNNPHETPVIIIMQRIHQWDMSGFVLGGGTGENWEHLCIPAINDNGEALWPQKHTIEMLREKQAANPFVFASQYMQTPIEGIGNMFTAEMFEFGPMPSRFDYSYVTMDTAYTDKQSSDSTAMVAGLVSGNQLYIDRVYEKQIKSSEVEKDAIAFIRDYTNYGFRGAYIEPKGHGIYLNQRLPQLGIVMPGESNVTEFFKDRRLNKVERANNVIPRLTGRKIIINENIPNKEKVLEQLLAFPKGKHDDIVDCIIDLVKLVYCKEVSILDVL